jgi:hypothetical protein
MINNERNNRTIPKEFRSKARSNEMKEEIGNQRKS